MGKYVKYKNKGGNRYTYQTKFVKPSEVPEDIKSILDSRPGRQEYIEVVPGTSVPLYKDLQKCLFCGEPCRFERRVNGQTVALCKKDYYDKNIGTIAQKIREANDNVRQEKEEKILD